MSEPTYSFDSFSVGDYVAFERSYAPADFVSFSALSHDRNPLHHDAGYAERSPFGRPIVPLHLTLSPLSMIAGMVFPGESSLYLGHDVRAAHPVYYGDTLRYSARIEAINVSHRVLVIRVLALRGSEVVLDAGMRVQSRADGWTTPPALPVSKASKPALAVITGASGEIGGAIAYSLAKHGWRLLLQDRGEGDRRAHLRNQLAKLQADATFVTADLAAQSGRDSLALAVARSDNVGLFIHAASPPVSAPVDELVAVNFSALRQGIDAALPAMLARQQAAIVLIGSSATEYALPGWESYTGAKSMAANLVDTIERAYATYGVRGLTIMPGFVATRFSEEYRSAAPALLPQEVAEAVVRAVTDERAPGNVIMLEPGRSRRGARGFHAPGAPAPTGEALPKTSVGTSAVQSTPRSRISAVVRKSLRLGDDVNLADAALGITPGWDSLKHIELLLAVEDTLGIRFASEEIGMVHDFAALDALCSKKLTEKGQGTGSSE